MHERLAVGHILVQAFQIVPPRVGWRKMHRCIEHPAWERIVDWRVWGSVINDVVYAVGQVAVEILFRFRQCRQEVVV